MLSPPSVDNIRVLIVDDDPDILKNIQNLLMTKKVCCHSSVHKIEEVIQKNDPHVIILDYCLGDGTAEDILKKIQPYVKKSIPVLFTGKPIPVAKQAELYMMGIMNIIYKPCTISTLEAIIENYYEVSMKYRN